MSKRTLSQGWLRWTVLPSLLIALTTSLAVAQEAPAKKEDVAAEKKRAEPKGRLPAYYADVVSGEQRAKIYSIQQKYTDSIKKLQQQIDDLSTARDKEVEAVLTPEQRDKVSKQTADAKAKRAATTAAAADAKKKAAATPPAGTNK